VYSAWAEPSARIVVNIALGAASILGVQLFAVLFNGLITDAAKAAHRETDSRIQLLARERIAVAVHAEYRRRYADLADNVRPLLETLRRGDAVGPALRRRAQTEYQRLRTLFDQSRTFDHALLQRLRRSIDAAQARGVDVSMHVEGELPVLTTSDVKRLTDPLTIALAAADISARIALTADSAELEASIVCRGIHDHDTSRVDASAGDADLQLTTMDGTAWLTVRHRTKEGRTTVEPTH
jgi:hypothetical protein